jgi:two-component system, LytTR family, response regulator
MPENTERIRAMVVDDDSGARNLVCTFLNRYFSDRIDIVGEADRVESAITTIRTIQPQLLFLDIDLTDGMGFEVLDLLGEDRKKLHVIFVTSYSEHVRRAIRYDAVDFIDKPIIPSEFKIGVERGIGRVWERESVHAEEETIRQTAMLTIRHGSGTHDTVVLRDILYCKADDNYTRIILNDNRIITASKTLKHYEDVLQAQGFVRVTRGLLINTARCALKLNKKNALVVLMPDGSEEAVDPSLQEAVRKTMVQSLE